MKNIQQEVIHAEEELWAEWKTKKLATRAAAVLNILSAERMGELFGTDPHPSFINQVLVI
jgi:hypothetical protein